MKNKQLEQNSRVQDQVEELSVMVRRLEFQDQLRSIDRAWENRSKTLMVKDKYGCLREPSKEEASLTIILGALVSVSLFIFAALSSWPIFVLLSSFAGVAFFLSAIMAYQMNEAAKRFCLAKDQYRRRRLKARADEAYRTMAKSVLSESEPNAEP
ncbi:MAG: hypothetical protein AB8B55_05825 [Mariniblastus sp.]